MTAFAPPPLSAPGTAHLQLAFDGSKIDGSLFRSVTGLARDTRWLNGPLESWTNLGLVAFALLMVLGWWRARKADDSRAMATALAAPVAVVVAFAVAEVAKKLVQEVRPCRSVPHAFIVETCPALNDYAFPSGHSTTAAATVAALYLVSRRLCAVAAVFALFEGFTRVYVGAHYPHDVLGAFVLALPVALAVSALLRRWVAPLVGRLGEGALRPLLTSAPSRAAHAAR